MNNSMQLSNTFFTGKMIWIPIGLLLFSIIGMMILFIVGSSWFDYQQAMRIGVLVKLN